MLLSHYTVKSFCVVEMEKPDLNLLLLEKDSSILDAMRAIDRNSFGIVLLIDDDSRFFGLVTDGDIRRAILSGKMLTTPVSQIANTNALSIQSSEASDREKMLKNPSILARMPIDGSLKIPVLDDDHRIVDVQFLQSDRQKLNGCKSFVPRPVNRVLVTGGAGYIGSVLCRKLIKKGYMVRVLDSLIYGSEGVSDLLGNPKFELIAGDLLNIGTMLNSLEGVDAIIHLADIVGDPACAVDPKMSIQNNFIAGRALAEAARYLQINRFVFASSCSVYGFVESGIANEESDLNPQSLYASIKHDLERGILSLTNDNFSPTILRLSTVYGLSPRMRFDLVANVMIAKAYFDKKVQVFGGKQFRPLVHVSDVADAFIACIESPIVKVRRNVFNLGSNEQNYRILELGKLISSLVEGTELEVVEEKEDNRSYSVCFDKLNNELGFSAKKTISDAVSEITEEFRNGRLTDYSDERYSDYKLFKQKLSSRTNH